MTEPEEDKYRIVTMDDPEYYKLPRVEYKMSEEMKAKNFCHNKFQLVQLDNDFSLGWSYM